MQPVQLRRVNHVGRHENGLGVGDESVDNKRDGIVVSIDDIVFQFDVNVSASRLSFQTKVRSVVKLHFAVSRVCRQ